VRIAPRSAINELGAGSEWTCSTGGEARATITVTNVNVVVPDGGTQMTRPDIAQYWISYQDCLDNTQFQFTVTLPGPNRAEHPDLQQSPVVGGHHGTPQP